VELQGEQGKSLRRKKTASEVIEEKMDSKDLDLYQSPNNESSSCSLLSSTKGISVTVFAKAPLHLKQHNEVQP